MKLKKIISVLLVLTLVLSFAPVLKLSADAAQTSTSDGARIKYEITDGNATVTRIEPDANGIVDVPAEIDGYPVTELGLYAVGFDSNTKVIKIPASVEYITSAEAVPFKNLEKITVDENNTSYFSDENGVLYSKDKTKLWVVPAKNGLESFEIPAEVTTIADYALSDCADIKEFTVAEGNESFSADENGVLYNNNKTQLVRYPAASDAQSFTVAGTVEYVWDCAFAHAGNLVNLIIPRSVSDVGDRAFFGCSGLRYMTVPVTAVSGYSHAFNGCAVAEKISFESDVMVINWSDEESETTSLSIGANAEFPNFSEWDIAGNIKSIELDETHPELSLIDGVLYDKNAETLLLFPFGSEKTEYVMPDTVRSVEDSLLASFLYPQYPTSLKSVTLGSQFGYKYFEYIESASDKWEKSEYYYTLSDEVMYFTVIPSIEEIKVSADHPYLCAENGTVYSKDKEYLVALPYAENEKITLTGNALICADSFVGRNLDIVIDKSFSQMMYEFTKKMVEFDSNDQSEEYIMQRYYLEIANMFSSSTAKSFTVSADDEYLSVVDGVLMSKDGSFLIKYPIESTDSVYVIPETVTDVAGFSIGDTVYSPFTSLNVTQGAYYCCDNLTVHVDPSKLTGIDFSKETRAFQGVKKLCVTQSTSETEARNALMLTGFPVFESESIREYYLSLLKKYIEINMYPRYMNEILFSQAGLIGGWYGQIEVCGGDHTYKMDKVSDEVEIDYDANCFGELDGKVQLRVSKDTDEVKEEFERFRVNIKGNPGEPLEVYDISVVDPENPTQLIQPEGKVRIRIKLSEEAAKSNKLIVYHFVADPEFEPEAEGYSTRKGNLTIEKTDGETYLVFEVTHFSLFAVCAVDAPQELEITKTPAKTAYNYKGEIDLSGIELKAVYADGTIETVTDTSKMTVSGFDSEKVGTQTVTVEYEGAKAEFEVTVSYAWWQWVIRILLLGFLWY